MGSSHSRTPSRDPLPNVPDHQVMDVFEPQRDTPRRSRKRKADTETEKESKKVAKLNTCAYVYEKLFLQGEDSDITISACGREWKVHKLYLKQAKFFETMLGGDWKDSKCGRLPMEITDPNINADGLHAVLGSLYHNEIEIDLEKIEPTVAAASYILLESVTDRCGEMMIDALSTDNVVRFYDLSTRYGMDNVREKSMQLLLQSFWRIMLVKEKLKEVDRQLLLDLLTSPDLLIIEGEFDMYKVVKLWIYMNENPDCRLDDSPEIFSHNSSQFFKRQPPNAIFEKYSDVFSCLRMEHFFSCSETIKAVKSDMLIPGILVDEVSSALWMSLLENEEKPKSLDEISNETFFKRCIRLGRSLESYPKCWRWIGFNFGVDLLLHINDYSVSIKRNCLNQKAPYSVNLRTKHLLHYRLVICDSAGIVVHDSGKASWEMKPDEAKTLFRMPEELNPPISLHFQYLIHAPIRNTARYVAEFIGENYPDEEE